jgi:hypothetical protein
MSFVPTTGMIHPFLGTAVAQDSAFEGIVTRTVATRTYGAVATGGCHGTFSLQAFLDTPLEAGERGYYFNFSMSPGFQA